MREIFTDVMELLELIANVTGFTYREINIICYFIIIPFFYVALVDKIITSHKLKIIYVSVWVFSLFLISDFEKFSHDFFDVSVVFLNSWQWLGMDYIAASVVFCVFIPLIIWLVLIWFAYKEKLKILLSIKTKP